MNPIERLETGEITLEGQFLWGSNYTLLVDVNCGETITKAVYKPSEGVRPLWDFDAPTLARREVMAYMISTQLGWDLVPPTVYRSTGPMGPGSLQLFIEHDPEYHFFSFSEEDRQRLRPAALFDVLINNADRKGGHFIVDETDHIWLIDHGVCFHEDPKLRTVLWDFSGDPIPENLIADLRRLKKDIANDDDFNHSIHKHLTERETSAMIHRIDRIVNETVYPEPPENTRPYPWPLV